MIKDILELNFPSYATLAAAVCSLPDMGEKSIASTVKIDGKVAPDFSFDWEVAFKGEKYIMPLRQPQASKSSDNFPSSLDLTFQHWAVWQLKRFFFFSVVNLEAQNVLPDQYDYPVSLNLGDFCSLFGKVLNYYYGDSISIDLNPGWVYSDEPSTISISHTYIWDVLIQFYEVFSVRWQIEPKGDIDHYVIKVGYPSTEVEHVFEYGFDGGLLKVERQVQDENIRNMIIGRGGEKNLPYRYFKRHDENNVSFSPDPDWIPELASRYFSELHGATFRSYVQGWRAAHIEAYKKDYPDLNWELSVSKAADAYAPWAWLKGFSDSVFNPVEFVADEIVTSPQIGDRYVQILPDFNAAVRKDSSIDNYGPLFGGLDSNEDIYPTIQGVSIPPLGRIDQIVDVEEILSDNIEIASENVVNVSSLRVIPSTARSVAPNSRASINLVSDYFLVDAGLFANVLSGPVVLSAQIENRTVKWIATPKDSSKPWEQGMFGTEWNLAVVSSYSDFDHPEYLVIESVSGRVVSRIGSDEHSLSAIPEGMWRLELSVVVHNTYNAKPLDITAACESAKVVSANPVTEWADTWDIWVKNIWQTKKYDDESDVQYAERVWGPILGDRDGNEAKVVFSSGWLSTSEDYEFVIAATPVYDTSKSLDGVQSHWRISLGRSDADLKATDAYLPSTKRHASPGDFFFFIGIDMPHLYVVEAEKRLDDWKKDELAKVSDIKPTWVVSLDKVRICNHGNPGAIIDSLRPGNSLTLRDERFIPGSHQEKLYLTSVTYTYTEPTDKDANILPDVEVVLSDSYSTSANPVSLLQGEVSDLQKQVGAISNIEQIVRAVGDRLYLRKDGFSDRSYSPTEFASLLSSVGFRNGIIGGSGWGFFRDESGNWVLETDRINVRQEMSVSSLVINQAEGRGGMQIDTAAFLEISRVEESDDAYICYFDQKQGSVANLFHVDDVAFNQRWTPENQNLKFYKRRVVAVAENSISLSKSEVNGSGVPDEGDIVIHFGNYSDKSRQYVKVRDVVGGGYERYIEGLDSVFSDGTEYFFVGRQSGMYGDMPRWYIGNPDSNIEYVNRKFNLNNVALSVSSTIGGKSFEQYIIDAAPKVTEDGIRVFVNNITKSQFDSVQSRFDNIQKQVDGAIEAWFGEGKPTISSYPAADWIGSDIRDSHLGDLYYDRKTGDAYRFQKAADNLNYDWVRIQDTDVAKVLGDASQALADAAAAQASADSAGTAAANAQSTANAKMKVFAVQPTPPYQQGDLWVNATYGTLYSNDILRCKTTRTSGSFDIADWQLASKYTDDTLAQKAITDLAGLNYIKTALANDSYLNGGLFLTSLIRLGTNNKGVMEQSVNAGINGVMDSTALGNGIALWLGGEQEDREAVGANLAKAAATLFRFDGSGYLAKGNISWNNDGSGSVAGGNISWDNKGRVTIGSGVSFNVSNVYGLKDTLDTLTAYMGGLDALFEVVDTSGKVQTLTWAAANPGSVAAIKARRNLFSEGYITAYGTNPDSAAAGSGGGINFGDLADKGYMTQTEIAAWLLSGYGLGSSTIASLALKTDLSLYALKSDLSLYALKTAIPTKVGQLTNDSGYITSAALSPYAKTADLPKTLPASDVYAWAKAATKPAYSWGEIDGKPTTLGGYGITDAVTLGTGQTIPAQKFFSAETWFTKGGNTDPASGVVCAIKATAPIAATQFIRSGGTASQFLKADGSVDNTAYLPKSTYDTFKALFDSMFEVKDGAIHAKMSLWSDGFITAYGQNPDGTAAGGGGGGLTVGDVQTILSNGKYVTESQLPDLTPYAKKTDIPASLKNPYKLTFGSKSYDGSAAVTLTASDLGALTAHQDISGKVDKVSGKGLSANDFTDALKAKLDGIAAGANNYSLPTASGSVKGGVRVGDGLSIVSEVLSVSLKASHIPALEIAKITGLQTALDGKAAKATTLAGYGIANAYTKTEVDTIKTALDTAVSNLDTTLTAAIDGKVSKAGDTMTGDLSFGNVTGGTRGIQFTFGGNDYARIVVSSTGTDVGQLEIATADNGNEPILIRQYTGKFTTIARTLSLLDASGNTLIPGSVGIGTTTMDTKLHVNGGIKGSSLYAQYMELSGGTPFIDFHFNNSTADYTSRIIEAASGTLTLNNVLKVTLNGQTEVTKSLKIGECVITYENGMLHFSKGLYSDGFITAYGTNPDNTAASGGGGIAWGDIQAHLKTYYGLETGTLATLARKSEIPSLSGYATESWVSANFNKYVLTKAAVEAVLTGNITSHTHSQYLTNIANINLSSGSLNNYGLTETKFYYAGGNNSVTDKPNGVDAFGVFTMRTADGWKGQILLASNKEPGLYWRADTPGDWSKLANLSDLTWANVSGKPNVVTTDTEQKISGKKIIANPRFDFLTSGKSKGIYFDQNNDNGDVAICGHQNLAWVNNILRLSWGVGIEVTGTIKKVGGTSAQVLMADGSVQSHYKAADVTSASSDNGMITPLAMNNWTSKTFLKLSGGTMTNTNLVTNLNADMVDGVHNGNLSAGYVYVKDAPITSTANDTINKWGGLPFINWYSVREQLIDQPSQYGFLINVNRGTEVHQLWLTQASGSIFHRGGNAAGWSGTWREVVDSVNISKFNAGSATKLATARSIFGQSFNGEGDVSGNATVAMLIASGEIRSSNANAFRAAYGDYGCFLRNDGANTYLMLTAKSDPYGTWNDLRPLVINNATGNVTLGVGALVVEHGGHVITPNELHAAKLISTGNIEAAMKVTAQALELSHATPYIDFHFDKSTSDYTTRLIEEASGRLKLEGTLHATTGIYCDGYITAYTAASSSDARLKDVGGDIALPLEAVAAAPWKRFSWKADPTRRANAGGIAQYWLGVLPEVVRQTPDGMYSLEYGVLGYGIGVENAREIARLKARIAELEEAMGIASPKPQREVKPKATKGG